jgi:uncharacterized protein with HEPN domain
VNRRADDRVTDILTAIERVLSYRGSLSAEDAVISGMAYDAVLRNLAVIGEAVRALPDEFKMSRADVPWPAIAGMRNIVIHEYFRVDRDVMLDIIDTHLSTLADSLRKDPG